MKAGGSAGAQTVVGASRHETEAAPPPLVANNPPKMPPTINFAAVADMVADRIADRQKPSPQPELRINDSTSPGRTAVCVRASTTPQRPAAMASAMDPVGVGTPITPHRPAAKASAMSPTNQSTINFGSTMNPILRKVCGAFRWSESQACWVVW